MSLLLKNALLVECGQHWEKSSEDVAIKTLIKFLRHTGVMDNNFGEEIISNEIVSSNQIEISL